MIAYFDCGIRQKNVFQNVMGFVASVT